MSHWVHITGTIVVEPLGRTQHEMRYILETVLDHLPVVTGSEDDMHVYVVQKAGYNCSSSCDEFGMTTNNMTNRYGRRDRDGGFYTQDNYMLVVEGDLRDREFDQTYREFINWLCRLAKRVNVNKVVVNIEDYCKSVTICETKYNNPFHEMFEWPSWSNEDGEPNWCEYLMWDSYKGGFMPAKLAYKYYADDDNDKRVKNWMGIEENDK